jgi:hypothetical protein
MSRSNVICYSPRSGKELAEKLRNGTSWVTKKKVSIGTEIIKPQEWDASVRTSILNLAVTIPKNFDITKLSHWFAGAMAGHLAGYSVTMSNRAETADEIVETTVRITNISGPRRFRVDLAVDAYDMFETEILRCRRTLWFSYRANTMRWHDTAYVGAKVGGLTMWPNPEKIPSFQVDPDTGMNKYTFADGFIMSQSTDAEAYNVDVPLHLYIM